MTTQTAHTRIKAITERIIERSKPTREAYIGRVREAAFRKPHRSILDAPISPTVLPPAARMTRRL